MQNLQVGAEVWVLKPCLVRGSTKHKQLYSVDVKPTMVTESNRERLAAGWGVRVFGDFETAFMRVYELPEVYYDDLGKIFAALEQAAK